MNEDDKSKSDEADAQLEREIRRDRKFSLAEAIGRMGGPGATKGGSPVTQLQQAYVEIENWLRVHLTDGAAGLEIVLLRGVNESELIAKNFDQPLVVLRSYCEKVLGSPYLLEELVRCADTEWGQIFNHRPYFERSGSLPDANDPYTIESVRKTLSDLVARLGSDD